MTDVTDVTDLTITVRDQRGVATAETVKLPAELFDVQANVALMHQVVVAQLGAARQGTHDSKTRGEVRGGGAKPYRQKGTGRARQGSLRAPQYAGGGTVHGPSPRDYSQRTPKKMKAAALRGALSDRVRDGRVHVISAFLDGDTPSTKDALSTLTKVAASKKVLVVAERDDLLTWKSLRNIPAVHLLAPGQLNTYDVLVSDEVVFTRTALEVFVGRPVETGVAEILPEDADEADEAGDTEQAEAKPAKKAAKKAAKAPAKKAAKKAAEKSTPDDADSDGTDAAEDAPKPAAKKAAKKAAAKKATKAAPAKDDSEKDDTAKEDEQ